MTSTPRATGEVWSERARLLCESHLFGTVHGVTRENVSVREDRDQEAAFRGACWCLRLSIRSRSARPDHGPGFIAHTVHYAGWMCSHMRIRPHVRPHVVPFLHTSEVIMLIFMPEGRASRTSPARARAVAGSPRRPHRMGATGGRRVSAAAST